MIMTVADFHDEIVSIQAIITSKGLKGEVAGHINWIGNELDIGLSAKEEYDINGYWSKETRFSGFKIDGALLLAKAKSWAYNIPNEDDRAIEFMVQQLNKLVEKLPHGHGSTAVKAWEEIGKMLLDRAEHLAKHGLPSPESISSVDKEPLPSSDTIRDHEIAF